MEKFLGRWNRYLYNRILEPDENLRIKLNLETSHFKFYFRNAESFNFPAFSDTLETAYTEYVGRLNVQPLEKLTFFTIPECKAAEINGVACGNRLTSGTAWSSGLNTSCAYELSQLPAFTNQNRHELAHAMQGNLPQGSATSWVNEGFACFYAGRGPYTQKQLENLRQELSNAMKKAEEYFGHRPTYEDAHVYPNPDYGYYTLGTYFIDYIYRRGGDDQAVKDVCVNDTVGFKKMEYDTPDDFLKSFYYDFDVRINQKGMVDLTYPSPANPVDENNVTLKWTPLDRDVKLNVSVSLNDTSHWTSIATGLTQSELVWNAPENFSGKFYLKFSHTAYKLETILGPFLKNNMNSLNLLYPEGNEILFADDTVSIRWANTRIPDIRIDFSSDDGATWSEVKSNVETTNNSFDWHIPYIVSSNCRLRITEMGGSASSQCSNAFRIVEANTPGGPYKTDNHTVVLLHFDNNLKNQSVLSADGTCLSSEINYSSGLSDGLGLCIKPELPIKIPHCSNLNLSGDWTIEAWVKFVSFTANNFQTIVTKPGDSNAYEANFSLLINPYWDNVFQHLFFAGTNNRISVTARKPDLNEWYHIMCTRDTRSSKIKIVVRDKNLNIVDIQEQSFTGNEVYINSQDLIIGENFCGYLDELRISNIVRSFDKPAAPQLISPENNGSEVTANPDVVLNWTNGNGTQRVDLYVSETNTPETRLLDNVAAVNTYTLSSPDQGTKYFWKVVCRNANGSTEGPVWSFTTDNKTGIEDNYENRKDLSIYPNPAKDIVYIVPPQSESGLVDLKIFNASGVQVYSGRITTDSRVEVNIEHFPKGTYLVQIKDGNRSLSGKFVRNQ
ncbi:MAG TPA: T9SS type A sorting domain-containing protein, partial [Bacteroidales bacterium]|nr:T9SS type A sorting domain-containing protein [Bacteroidales bacterium]